MPYPSQWQGRLRFPSSPFLPPFFPFSPPVLRHAERREGAIQALGEPEGAIPDVANLKGDDDDVSEGDGWQLVASSEAGADDAGVDDPDDPTDLGTPHMQAPPAVQPPEEASTREQGTEGPEPRRPNRAGSAPRRLIEESAFAVHKVDLVDDVAEYQIQENIADAIQTKCIYTKHSANPIGPTFKRPCSSKKFRRTKFTDIGNLWTARTFRRECQYCPQYGQ
jgi:hypothetical protein